MSNRPVMTLRECVSAMRDSGIPCSEERIGDEIESGLLPFGRVKHVGKTGYRSFEIWRVDFNQWLAEKKSCSE